MSKNISWANIIWNEHGHPMSSVFDDVYYSKSNGLAETQHVFLDSNNLPARWLDGGNFNIFETGFGTGLNLWATWQLWAQSMPHSGDLHFITVEKFPLKPEDMARACARWPQLEKYTSKFLPHYEELIETGSVYFEEDQIRISLCVGDILDGLKTCNSKIDAWFLDGFAPAKNPDMWQEELYTHMENLSRTGASAATFTAAGDVKRGLESHGFDVTKQPGFGHKREMITAVKR